MRSSHKNNSCSYQNFLKTISTCKKQNSQIKKSYKCKQESLYKDTIQQLKSLKYLLSYKEE